jgi:hypothetical protein
MVFLMLAAMLILSAVTSVGSVLPVVGAFVLFMIFYGVYMAGCMLPGYVRARRASAMTATVSRARSPRIGPGLPAAR